jgi:hypothetical protein
MRSSVLRSQVIVPSGLRTRPIHWPSISEGLLVGDVEMGTRVVPASLRLVDTTPFDAVVPAGVVTSPRDLVTAAAEIAHELVAEFNASPTRPVLSADGLVNDTAGWPAVGLRGWALQHHLLKSDN